MPSPSRTAATNRNTGVDVLRIVSIAAVVLGHVYGANLLGGQYLEIWRMPLFFFLSGFFFTPGRSFRSEVGRRWRTLAVPYLVWAVIMSVVAWVWNHENPDEFRRLLFYGWYGGSQQDPPWWAFWFISVLFIVTLLHRFLERFPAPVSWSVAIAGLLLVEFQPFGDPGMLPLGVGLAIPSLFYLLCGEYFRYRVLPKLGPLDPRGRAHSTTNAETSTPPLGMHSLGFLGITLVCLGAICVTVGVQTHNIKFSGFGWFLITPMVGVMMVIGMVLIFGTWINRIVQWAAPAIDAVVRTGTVVVLAHGWILIELVRHDVEQFGLRLVLTLVLSWGLGLIINATPLAPLLAGVPTPQWWVRWKHRRNTVVPNSELV